MDKVSILFWYHAILFAKLNFNFIFEWGKHCGQYWCIEYNHKNKVLHKKASHINPHFQDRSDVSDNLALACVFVRKKQQSFYLDLFNPLRISVSVSKLRHLWFCLLNCSVFRKICCKPDIPVTNEEKPQQVKYIPSSFTQLFFHPFNNNNNNEALWFTRLNSFLVMTIFSPMILKNCNPTPVTCKK